MIIEDQYPEITKKCKKLVECDTARISHPVCDGKMFLIIGFNRNTTDDEGEWIINGDRCNFEYTQEKVVASGYTEEDLIKSVKEYVKLSDMTMEEYLKEYYNVDIKKQLKRKKMH